MTIQATVLAPVYPSMRSEELGRFMVRLLGALEKRPGEYHSISVWSFIAVSPAVLAEVLHRSKWENMFALFLAHRSGQLLVTHDILIGGGITAHHLKHQLQFWRSDLTRVLQVVRDSQGKTEGWRLN